MLSTIPDKADVVGALLLFAALGNAIPILGELLAIHVLKVIRHHIQPQTRGVPLAIALGWYNVG